ncbi:MAG: hypothetical protein KKC46_22105 [Proteobacteria bacterium]|nr:hypothetical protein [Pseudomonadota bacterium]
MINESELEKLNEEFRKEDIEPRRRPFEALRRISMQTNRSIIFPSAEADFVFKWFEANTKPGAHTVGFQHQGTYYYDSTFWSVNIPIIFGSVQLNALDALHEMPQKIKDNLYGNRKAIWDYIIFWADCIDFGYAYDDLYKDKNHDTFGRQLLCAGYEELSSATTLLLEHRPNKRAIMNCRMATEMLLKCFIALKDGLTETQAKKLGHNLENIFVNFLEVSGYQHLAEIKNLLRVFPDIHERYKAQEADNLSLFNGYCFAQSIGALIARAFTDRNTLPQVMPSNKPN